MRQQRTAQAIALGLLLLGVACLPLSAHAVDITGLEIPIIQNADLLGLIGRIINVILLWGGIIAFFYVLYAGFQYLTAGGDDGTTGKARKTIINAIIGIIIVFVSYAVVNYVISSARSNFSNVPNPVVTVHP